MTPHQKISDNFKTKITLKQINGLTLFDEKKSAYVEQICNVIEY